MGARQKAWAKIARAQLIGALGSKCRACNSRSDLTFDCLSPLGSAHHEMDSSARMCFYRKVARQGGLTLLCRYCNSLKQAIAKDEFASAIAWVRECDAIQSACVTPGLGTALSPADRRECLRAYVSRLLATKHHSGVIQ